MPIVNFPGRNGLDLNLTLYYNNRVWAMSGDLTEVIFNADCDHPSYGFRLDFGHIVGPFNNDVGTTSYILTEADGTKRELRFSATNVFNTYDATYIEWNSSTKVLRRKDGTQITYGVVPNTTDKFRPTQIKDTNGNYITITYTASGHTNINTLTDTAGRVITFTYDASNKISQVKQGTVVYATFTWGTQPLNYNFAPSLTVNGPANGTVLNVITRMTLANGGAYEFTWGDWGLVTKIATLNPSGSTRSYVRYDPPTASTQLDDAPGFSNQFVSDNGVAESAWAFSFTKDTGKNVTSMTSTDSANTVTQKDYFTSGWQQGLAQTETTKQGTTTLRTVAHTWTQDNTAVSYKTNPRRTVSSTTLSDTGQQSKVAFTYTTNGNVSQLDEYDWGLVLVWTTKQVYLTSANYTSRHILDRPIRTQVWVGTSLKAWTNFEYDNYTAGIAANTAVQHDTTNYGAGFTYRGNVTAVQRWRNTDFVFLTTRSQYDKTGNVLSTTDPGSHTTSFSYADSFSDGVPRNTFAYQTQATNALSQVSSSRYYFDSGRLERTVDANNQITSYTYDNMYRSLVTSLPDGGQTTLSYDDNTPAVTETTKIDAIQNLVRKTVFDGNGRVIQTQLVSDPQGTVFVDIAYDAQGRKATESNPYRSVLEPTYGVTQYQYDDLSRLTKIIPPDGTSGSNNVTFAYSGNCVTTTEQAGKKSKKCSDAPGRVTNVWEPDAGGNFLYETRYQYDALDDLIQIDQKGNTADTTLWRTRTFTYNSLKQKTAQSTPEGGSESYTYNSDGLLTSKTDARNISIAYAYDALHRQITVDFSDTVANPDTSYFYDQTTYNGLTVANGIGQRTGMSDASGQTARSFDAMGRALEERRTNNGVTLQTSYTYAFNGALKSLTYPSGRRIDYSYNAAARPVAAVDVANGINYVTDATYAPQGTPASLKNGVSGSFAGLTRNTTYNKRLQPDSLITSTPSQTLRNLTYDYGLNVADNGNVKQVTNNLVSGRTQTYTYDELNRIKTAEVPADWGLSFTYDVWGNLLGQTVTKGSAPMLSVTVGSQNKITDTGYSYDGAGNLTNDGINAYTYNAESRTSSAAGVTYSYDGDGQRVKKSSGKLYWYGPSGSALLETDLSGALLNEYVFFEHRRIARRTAAGSVFYFFTDHLSSVRLVTNGTGTIVEDSDYYPFGGERVFVHALDNNYKFTGHERDTESGLDYYLYRMLSSRLGRWTSTDPVMQSPQEPQSLNGYGYVADNPTNFKDPLGLFRTVDRGPKKDTDDNCGDAPTGGGSGGGSPFGQCFAQLKTRPTSFGIGTHSFWYVQDILGVPYIVSGLPVRILGLPLPAYLNSFITINIIEGNHTPGTGHDNVLAPTFWQTPPALGHCLGVALLLGEARAWPQNTTPYHLLGAPFGQNSNTFAHRMGNAGGFSPPRPPGAVGW